MCSSDLLLPLLSGANESPWRDAVTGSYMQTQRMITVGTEKLLLYPEIQVSLLYDLAADPEELRDASGDAAGLERKRKLFQRLLQEQQQMGDDLDLRAKFPELAGN